MVHFLILAAGLLVLGWLFRSVVLPTLGVIAWLLKTFWLLGRTGFWVASKMLPTLWRAMSFLLMLPIEATVGGGLYLWRCHQERHQLAKTQVVSIKT